MAQASFVGKVLSASAGLGVSDKIFCQDLGTVGMGEGDGEDAMTGASGRRQGGGKGMVNV